MVLSARVLYLAPNMNERANVKVDEDDDVLVGVETIVKIADV